MNDPAKQYQELAKKLYERTTSGTLHWYIDQWTEKLTTSLAGYNIQLDTGETAEGEPIIQVSILNQSNDYIDGFNDETLSSYETGVEEAPTYWKLLDRLYKTAYRGAKGADKALQAIMNELDLDDDVPF